MYCKKCGAELLEGIKFCPECGEPVGSKEVEVVDSENLSFESPEQPKKHVPKCFTIFGRVGFGLALAGFICGFIPYICMVGLELATIGLVFSILGKRDPELEKKTKLGKIFGILGLVFGFIMTIVTVVIMAELGLELYY